MFLLLSMKVGFIDQFDKNLPHDALYVYAENA